MAYEGLFWFILIVGVGVVITPYIAPLIRRYVRMDFTKDNKGKIFQTSWGKSAAEPEPKLDEPVVTVKDYLQGIAQMLDTIIANQNAIYGKLQELEGKNETKRGRIKDLE